VPQSGGPASGDQLKREAAGEAPQGAVPQGAEEVPQEAVLEVPEAAPEVADRVAALARGQCSEEENSHLRDPLRGHECLYW
jgi:hypothetical protein